MGVVFGVVAFAAAVRLASMGHPSGRAIFGMFAWSALFALIGFRDFGFGPDTEGYIARYEALQEDSWQQVLEQLTRSDAKDPVFYIIAKAMAWIGIDTRGWILILAAVFCVSLGGAVHRYSPEPFLSYLATLSLGFAYFAMTGLRQTVAISILLWAWGPLRDRRFLRFGLLILIASLFHSSALIFFIIYPIAKWEPSWRQGLLIVGSLLVALLTPELVRSGIRTLAWNDSLEQYAEQTATLSLAGFVIVLAILMYSRVFIKQANEREERLHAFYNSVAVAVALQALVLIVAESFRVAYYFTLAAVFLVPAIISWGVPKRDRSVHYVLVASALLGYMIWTSQFDGLSLVLG